MGSFEALKFMKLMEVMPWLMAEKIWESPLSGSGWEWHSHDGWSSQIATVPSKFATGAVCNAVQCWGGGRGINGTISVSGTETGWRGRQRFNPARNDTKWLPLAWRELRQSRQCGGLFIHEMLRNHCYSALKYVISCGLHSKIEPAQKTFCLFS